MKKQYHDTLKLITRTSIFIFSITLINACSREYYDITWQAVIVDKKTNQPLPFVDVLTTSTFQNNIDHSRLVTKTFQSDMNGHVQCHFEKAYRIRYEIEAYSYLPLQSYLPIRQLHHHIDTIRLQPQVTHDDLTIELISYNHFVQQPFLRSRKVFPKNSKKNNHYLEEVGFDFLHQCHTLNTDSMDLKITIRNHQTIPPVIVFRTFGEGGIFPVMNKEINQSFLFEYENAPEKGYLKSYRYTGKEAGLFIKCRDNKHFAKIIPDHQLCRMSYSSATDSVEETGMRLSYILQRDTVFPRYFPAHTINDHLNNNPLSTFFKSQENVPLR